MVNVDQNKCIGCGLCTATCPDVFEMGDDGKAKIKEGAKPDEKCKEAANSCPVQAITV